MANKTQRLNETYQIRPGVNGQALITQNGVRWGEGGGGGSLSVGEGLHIYEGEVTLGGKVSKKTMVEADYDKEIIVTPFNQEIYDLLTDAYGGGDDENNYTGGSYGLGNAWSTNGEFGDEPIEYPEGSGNFYTISMPKNPNFIANNYGQSEVEWLGGETVRMRVKQQISIGGVGEAPALSDNPTPEEVEAAEQAMHDLLMDGVNIIADTKSLDDDWNVESRQRTMMELGYSGVELRTRYDEELSEPIVNPVYGAKIFANSSFHTTAGITVTDAGLTAEQKANGRYPQMGLDYIPALTNNSMAGRTQFLANPFLSFFSGLNSVSSRSEISDLSPNGSPLMLTGYGGVVLNAGNTGEVLVRDGNGQPATIIGLKDAESASAAVPKSQLDSRLSEGQRTAINALDASTATVEDLINALQA